MILTVSKYVRQKSIELQGEIDESTIIFGDFSTPLSEMSRFSRQKINKDIIRLNNTINQLYIMDSYRLLYPPAGEYTFFASSHGTFIKTDHMLYHNNYQI